MMIASREIAIINSMRLIPASDLEPPSGAQGIARSAIHNLARLLWPSIVDLLLPCASQVQQLSARRGGFLTLYFSGYKGLSCFEEGFGLSEYLYKQGGCDPSIKLLQYAITPGKPHLSGSNRVAEKLSNPSKQSTVIGALWEY